MWVADITYIPMAKGFLYLVAIMDHFSRYVLSWRVSNTSGPITGSPRSEVQRVLVARSYINLLFRYNIPEVPKVVASPRIFAEYTIPLPQRVHHNSDMGSPPRTSLTISWALTIRKG